MRDEIDVLLAKETNLLHFLVERLVDEFVQHGFGEGVESPGFEKAGAALEVVAVGLLGVEFDLGVGGWVGGWCGCECGWVGVVGAGLSEHGVCRKKGKGTKTKHNDDQCGATL